MKAWWLAYRDCINGEKDSAPTDYVSAVFDPQRQQPSVFSSLSMFDDTEANRWAQNRGGEFRLSRQLLLTPIGQVAIETLPNQLVLRSVNKISHVAFGQNGNALTESSLFDNDELQTNRFRSARRHGIDSSSFARQLSTVLGRQRSATRCH